MIGHLKIGSPEVKGQHKHSGQGEDFIRPSGETSGDRGINDKLRVCIKRRSEGKADEAGRLTGGR